MTGRLDDYHSLCAVLRQDKKGAFVRVLDRYYPGPPGPDYSTVINALAPWEARALAAELVEAAARADMKNRDIEIAEQTAKTAAAAKAAACTCFDVDVWNHEGDVIRWFRRV